jgi:hypothetical protein
VYAAILTSLIGEGSYWSPGPEPPPGESIIDAVISKRGGDGRAFRG